MTKKGWCRVLARCGKALVIVALAVTTGAHWAALQTVAWTTMLASNLRTHSVTEAVADTFDGKHPCPLCKAIAAAKRSEKKSEAVASTLKMEYPPTGEKTILHPPAQFEVLTVSDTFADSLSQKPPVPPPRRFSV
jgi:hypothetical protein